MTPLWQDRAAFTEEIKQHCSHYNKVREMARHRLARIPLIGATRGTRLAQVFAPLAYAAAWDITPTPHAPPGVHASQA
eukprot:scaffold17804_cov126-Isochrysis_galbana.AAC.3